MPLRTWDYARAAFPLLRWANLIYSHTIDLPLWRGRRIPHVTKVVGDVAWERSIRRGWIPDTTDVDDFQAHSYSPIVAWQKASRARQIRACDGVIVPSAYLKRMVISWGVPSEAVHVIYNALPPQNSAGPYNQMDARRLLNLSPSMPILLTVARLNPWKGVDHIITALRAVPEVRLFIAGDGPERQRLEKLAKPLGDRVIFLGNISREKVHLHLIAADYLILYSGYEGLSHTLLESLRVGTPIIASAKGGNPEVVQHNINGLLVPYPDPSALVDTLRLAFQPTQRETLASNHHVGMERFQFSTMVEQTHQLLRRFIS